MKRLIEELKKWLRYDEPDVTRVFAVTYSASDKICLWRKQNQSVLDLAENNNVWIDWNCRAGQCGTCEIKVIAGKVEYMSTPEFAPAEGNCLTCIARPASDLVLDI